MDAENNLRLFLFVLSTIFSLGAELTTASYNNTFSASEYLTGDQTLVSTASNFELGFFRPGGSQNYYMGIWYRKDSYQNRMVVWVANRDKPLYYQSSAELRLLRDGNLVLLNQASQIWSTNSTSNSTLEAVLGDDGNLVLRDVLNPSLVIWQSFDYPTDTWLPGMKLGFNKRTNKTQVLTSWRSVQDPAPGLYSLELDPGGIAQFIIVWNRSINFWTSGRWNGQFFHSKLEMQEILSIYNFSFTDNLSESYFTYTSHSNQPISNFVLGSEGQLKVFRWSKAMSEWNLFASKPKQLSEVYGVCGAFGILDNETMRCDCLPGFKTRYSGWFLGLGDLTGGCVRIVSLPCVEKYNFAGFRGVNTSKITEVRIAQVRSAEECELACSSNCSCNAYSYGRNDCLLFDGDLLNLVQQSDDGDLLNFKYQSYVSPKGLKLMYYVVAPISFLGVIVCIFLHRKKGVIIDFWKTILKQLKGLVIDLLKKTLEKLKESPNANMFRNGEDKGQTPELQLFDFAVLAIATNNFCLRNKLGQGGFGPVYKGKLRSGQEIAIKRLSKSSGQGIEEFKNEVLLISKLQHKNLVRLLGCCTEEEEYMLVYEYMPNKSLDAFLFDERKKAQLDWKNRFHIIHGIARGLLYLHCDSRLKIIHRDLKVSNILLDEEMNPKISDFGMARVFGGNQATANTNRVVGTFGYMSPEYILGGTFSEKSDVFSFGVLLLEIVSGKRNNSFYDPEQPLNLTLQAWKSWNEGKWAEIVDETFVDSNSSLEMKRCIHVGLLCVQKKTVDRPTMAEVDLMLRSEMNCPTPKEPPFVSATSSESDFLQVGCSNNNVTMTAIEPR